MKFLELLKNRHADPSANRPAIAACLGDSVTHGCFEVFMQAENRLNTRCSPSEGYVAGLARALEAMYPFAAPTFLNAGISGDNAPGGLKRFERDVLRASPDLVLINFGLNDACNPDVRQSLQNYQRAMRALMETALASGAECMLVTPNAMCRYVSHHLTDPFIRSVAADCAGVQNAGVLDEFVHTARAIAQSLGVPVADAYARWDALHRAGVDTTELLSNFINHPTPNAHQLFVREILDALLKQ